MRLSRLERRPLAVPWFAALGVALLAVGCNRTAPPPGRAVAGPRPTPAPALALPVDSSSHAALLAYAHGLSFDTTAPGVDRRYLVVAQGERLVVGPYAELAPEIGAAAISHADLVRGRILARVTVEGAGGSAPGVAYIWVDSVAGGFRAVFVPVSGAARMKVAPVTLAHYGPEAAFCQVLAVGRLQDAGPPDPPGDPLPFSAALRKVCVPCDCTMCCSDTT